MDTPLHIVMDGRRSASAIFKQAPPPPPPEPEEFI
jgi:hypothetical protein